MVTLSVKESNKPIKINFVRIGDLFYFEGPMLTLFENVRNGHLYIFDWVDSDNTVNRWLIHRVTPESLFKFINRQASHLELFGSNPDKRFYITELNNQYRSNDFELQELNEVPDEYYPNEDNYFDLEDSRFIKKIRAITLRELYNRKIENSFYPSDTVLSYNYSSFKVKGYNQISHLDYISYNDLTKLYKEKLLLHTKSLSVNHISLEIEKFNQISDSDMASATILAKSYMDNMPLLIETQFDNQLDEFYFSCQKKGNQYLQQLKESKMYDSNN